MDVILPDVEDEGEVDEFSTSDVIQSTHPLRSPDDSPRPLDEEESPGDPCEGMPESSESTFGPRELTKLQRDNSGGVDDLSMETESVGSGSSGLRRSNLESHVLKQMHEPVSAVPTATGDDTDGDAMSNDCVKRANDSGMYRNRDSKRDQGRARVRNIDADLDRDKMRDRERGRELDNELDSYSRYPDPPRDRDSDLSREARDSPVHVRDHQGSPVHGRDGRGSPLRGLWDRDRSKSPIRSYHREPLESARSSSPTRSVPHHRSPVDEHHHRSGSPTRGQHRDLDFQPILRASGLNGTEPSDWPTRNGTGASVGHGPLSGRQSTSSEQEMSRYFGNGDGHSRHLRSTPDSTISEKPGLADRSESSSGRRSVERLSEIMRRSNDRLADLDRGVIDTSWDRDRNRDLSRDRDRSQPRSRDISYDRASSDYHRDVDPYANDSDSYMTSPHDKLGLSSDVSNSTSQPTLRPALVTSRTTPLSASRTTPRPQFGSSGKTPSGKDDLEDNVSSLRRVLKEREREVDELKSQQRSLQVELHQAKNAEDSFDKAQFQKKVDGLIADRENLTTEVWRLKQELDRSLDRGSGPPPRSTSPAPGELDSFDPNNPRALRRKIKDLEGQVQDLQEANETASAKLSRTERLMQDALEESLLLRRNQDGTGRDLQEENALLKEQLESLRMEPSEAGSRAGGPAGGDGEYLQWEVRQLRTDLHHLRDRNHQLTQDNIKLTDYIRDLEARAALGTTAHSVDSDHYEQVDRYRKEREEEEVQHQHQQQQHQQLGHPPPAAPGYRSVSPTRHASDMRLFSPLSHATRNGDDLRFSNDVRKDTYLRSHSGGVKESRSQPLHAPTTNGFDYDDRPGRAISDKSDSTMYLTALPSSGLGENHDARPSAARELDFAHAPPHGLPHGPIQGPTHGQLADTKTLPPPTKVDMIDDLIDEPLTISRGVVQSAIPSTYTSSSSSSPSKRQHPGGGVGGGGLYPATTGSTTAVPPPAPSSGSLRPKSLEHDISTASNGRVPGSSVDDLDDEFFLGPGNMTYKVSSSPGSQYTEPFISHINKTYDELSNKSYSGPGNSGIGRNQPQEVVLPLYGGGMGLGANREGLANGLKDRSMSDNPYMNGLKDPMSIKEPMSIKDTVAIKDPLSIKDPMSSSIQQEIYVLDSDDSDGLDLKGPHPGSRRIENSQRPDVVSGAHGLQSGHQPATDRRDSIGSDSTDYILIQAEQHLQHAGSALHSPLSASPRGRLGDPPPPPPSNNKHFAGGSSLNSLPVPRSASPLHPVIAATSGGSGHQARPASVTPASRGPRPFSGETLTQPPGSPMPSASSLGTLTSQSRTLSPAFTVGAQKSQYSSSSKPDPSFVVSGKRPFAPRTVMDVKIEDVVKFTRQGGKISKGLIMYIGHLPGKNDTYLGIELEHEMGKHDGLYEGQRYFTCKPNRGVFVAFSRVVMAWSGPE